MSPTHFSISATFLIAMTGLVLCRTHLLSALLCLEMMMLSLYIGLSMWALQIHSTTPSLSPMVLLSFSACEASAGLALLVATARTHGSDRLQSFNLLRC
uniref:NADH-ubiquinone oxidoreductase chain 4L n=2 Tax=Trichonotus TaxID=270660 RepID=A0A679ERA7_9TELE|nr:NADH dehydrogenase subunit 4L [Trichonotus setiger]BAX03923.1 NADH dehydrogenase subunit 4L [Trichonotus elegans]BBU26053.1 NADH dehydrogenase subunit 4L [Trichonotus elegans]